MKNKKSPSAAQFIRLGHKFYEAAQNTRTEISARLNNPRRLSETETENITHKIHTLYSQSHNPLLHKMLTSMTCDFATQAARNDHLEILLLFEKLNRSLLTTPDSQGKFPLDVAPVNSESRVYLKALSAHSSPVTGIFL